MKILKAILFCLVISSCSKSQSLYERFLNSDKLIVIDRNPNLELAEFKYLKIEEIDRIDTVIVNEFLIKNYGDKAKNGAYFIYTKQYAANKKKELKNQLNQYIVQIEESKEPYLFILNGQITEDIELIKFINKVKELSAVHKLSFEQAKTFYGELAKKHTILVTTKDKLP